MSKFRFIDLFAGIGGFHFAMNAIGGECVFASEKDQFARKTYELNFKAHSPALFPDNFNDDITKVDPASIPDFDVLCAGFPCQPFSQAGHKRGFLDTKGSGRGSLFFHIARIIKEKRPRAYFLENVRGIINHDNGRTFKTIRRVLEEELGYSFYLNVAKASDHGLPQLRPRAFIIGFRDEDLFRTFSPPAKSPLRLTMSDVWEGECTREIGFTLRVGGRGSGLHDRRNWDCYLVDGEKRILMPLQAKRMQGFPDSFKFPVSNTQAMKQLGNSVAIDAVQAYATELINYLSLLTPKKQV